MRRSSAPKGAAGRAWRRLRAAVRLLWRHDRNPESISRGVGLGVAIGFLPLIGLQIVTAIAAAQVFKANKVAAAAGTLLTNPLTSVPFSALATWLGGLILPGERVAGTAWQDWAAMDWSSLKSLAFYGGMFQAYMAGNALLAIVGGLASYGAARAYFFWKIRREAEAAAGALAASKLAD